MTASDVPACSPEPAHLSHLSQLADAGEALPGELRSRLVDAGEVLGGALREAIVALGSKAVPGLITLLRDESLDDEDAEGDGWARVHAAVLLGALGDVAAVEPLLGALVSTEEEDPLYTAIAEALPRFGVGLVEPALALLGAAPSRSAQQAVCVALSECEVRDERIFARLEALLEAEPGLGALALGNYGDARALPLLDQGIRAADLDSDPRLALCDLDELTVAYRLLADALPSDLEGALEKRRGALREAVSRGDFPDEALEDELEDDLEFTVLRQLEHHPERPWVWVATCAHPDCDCREARVLIAQRAEDVEAAVALVGDTWDDEDSPPSLPPELARVVAALDVDIDSGAIQVPSWAGFPGSGEAEASVDGVPRVVGAATAGASAGSRRTGAPPFAVELIDGRLLDELHDQWLEGKGLERGGPTEESLERLSSWRSGELIPFHLAFDDSRLDCYALEDATYVLLEHHCPTPGCTCDQVMLDWQRLAGDAESVGEATWTPGGLPVFEGKQKALLQQLWTRFTERYPGFEARLKDRSRQMRAVGALLIARAKARRQATPPRHWVSSSKKGRKGAASQRGQRPRR